MWVGGASLISWCFPKHVQTADLHVWSIISCFFLLSNLYPCELDELLLICLFYTSRVQKKTSRSLLVFLFIEGSVESYHNPFNGLHCYYLVFQFLLKEKPQTSTGWSWPRWREYCSPVFGLFPSQRCLLYSELVNVELLNVNLPIFTLYVAVVTYSEPVSQKI